MGYEGYLTELLRPLGVYDLSPGRVNRAELAGYGGELDGVFSHLEESGREMLVSSAEDAGLARVEELLPYRPVSGTLRERRLALAALLRIGGDCFTPAAVNDTLAGCGINARARETGEPNRVEVWFPDTPGVPQGFDRLREIIEEILPCQLGIGYVFWFLTWAEARERFGRWETVAAMELSWDGFRSFVEN